jgi:DNA-binding transcriptional MerR regulator
MPKVAEDAAELVSIGELARDSGVSSRTIRYYEELGIIPEPRRSAGGTRQYPREYRAYIETALVLEDIKPLARLALGRAVSSGQRSAAQRLVEERLEALDQQVTVLRRLRDSVQRPGAGLAS